jgi:hypothetical protein
MLVHLFCNDLPWLWFPGQQSPLVLPEHLRGFVYDPGMDDGDDDDGGDGGENDGHTD